MVDSCDESWDKLTSSARTVSALNGLRQDAGMRVSPPVQAMVEQMTDQYLVKVGNGADAEGTLFGFLLGAMEIGVEFGRDNWEALPDTCSDGAP